MLISGKEIPPAPMSTESKRSTGSTKAPPKSTTTPTAKPTDTQGLIVAAIRKAAGDVFRFTDAGTSVGRLFASSFNDVYGAAGTQQANVEVLIQEVDMLSKLPDELNVSLDKSDTKNPTPILQRLWGLYGDNIPSEAAQILAMDSSPTRPRRRFDPSEAVSTSGLDSSAHGDFDTSIVHPATAIATQARKPDSDLHALAEHITRKKPVRGFIDGERVRSASEARATLVSLDAQQKQQENPIEAERFIALSENLCEQLSRVSTLAEDDRDSVMYLFVIAAIDRLLQIWSLQHSPSIATERQYLLDALLLVFSGSHRRRDLLQEIKKAALLHELTLELAVDFLCVDWFPATGLAFTWPRPALLHRVRVAHDLALRVRSSREALAGLENARLVKQLVEFAKASGELFLHFAEWPFQPKHLGSISMQLFDVWNRLPLQLKEIQENAQGKNAKLSRFMDSKKWETEEWMELNDRVRVLIG